MRATGLPERAIALLTAGGHTYEQDGALWFRSTAFGDDKDRVLRKSDGELTYFAVDIGFHHFVEVRRAGTRTSSTSSVRTTTAMSGESGRRCGRSAIPDEAFDVLIVQLVTLLREGQPVRMSKRRGEFVLMEELLEEVGRDAARFTFLTRRHDSPLEFDLAVATRQSADNPVYYVQYAHARVASLLQDGGASRAWRCRRGTRWTFDPARASRGAGADQAPAPVPRGPGGGAARAREPHRVAYYLTELAGCVPPILQGASGDHRGSPDDAGPARARRRGGPGDTERPRPAWRLGSGEHVERGDR